MTRSTRYGRPRLYVFDEGRRVGWLDMGTGARTLSDPLMAADFDRAVADYQSTHPKVRIPTPPQESGRHAACEQPGDSPADGPRVPGQRHAHWDDLAGTEPGAALRAKADQISQEAGEPMPEEAMPWLVGACGESITAETLQPLAGQGWHLINSVTLNSRGTDLDHLLIGPGGVFTINTKTHPQARVTVYEHAVYVNGGKHHYYIRNAEHEAQRVSKTLSAALSWPIPFVVPTLVFVATGTVQVKAHPLPVYVLAVQHALAYFEGIPHALPPEQVAAIYEVARRSTAWM